MIKNIVKLEAIQLRATGLTYSEIQHKLGRNIPKSTLSSWCSKIKTPKLYKNKIRLINRNHLQNIRSLALAKNKEKRKNYLDTLLHKNLYLLKSINKPQQKLLLSILYAAEGAKHSGTKFLSLTSSNPIIIKFFMSTLKNCYNIDENKLRVRIQCRFDQDVGKLEEYWQKVTGIGSRLFYRTYIDLRTKEKITKKKDYFGVCAVHYFSTEIQLELELLGNAIMQHIIKGR